MTFAVETWPAEEYSRATAAYIAAVLPARGTVVLTGGTTAEKVYPFLALETRDWSALSVAFSDERCVPPDDPASNYKMAHDLLLRDAGASEIHRMRGEMDPDEGAAAYANEIAPLIETGLDLMLLGMGADAHVGALYPGSGALKEEAPCSAVKRPDGLMGLTLTPSAMLSARKTLVLATGSAKAATVERVIEGHEAPETCPARLLASVPDVTFLLDEPAASALD